MAESSDEKPPREELHKLLGTLTLGGVTARLTVDPLGRKCIVLPFLHGDVCFTLSHALLIREVLDRGIQALSVYTPEKET